MVQVQSEISKKRRKYKQNKNHEVNTSILLIKKVGKALLEFKTNTVHRNINSNTV